MSADSGESGGAMAGWTGVARSLLCCRLLPCAAVLCRNPPGSDAVRRLRPLLYATTPYPLTIPVSNSLLPNPKASVVRRARRVICYALYSSDSPPIMVLMGDECLEQEKLQTICILDDKPKL